MTKCQKTSENVHKLPNNCAKTTFLTFLSQFLPMWSMFLSGNPACDNSAERRLVLPIHIIHLKIMGECSTQPLQSRDFNTFTSIRRTMATKIKHVTTHVQSRYLSIQVYFENTIFIPGRPHGGQIRWRTRHWAGAKARHLSEGSSLRSA